MTEGANFLTSELLFFYGQISGPFPKQFCIDMVGTPVHKSANIDVLRGSNDLPKRVRTLQL